MSLIVIVAKGRCSPVFADMICPKILASLFLRGLWFATFTFGVCGLSGVAVAINGVSSSRSVKSAVFL